MMHLNLDNLNESPSTSLGGPRPGDTDISIKGRGYAMKCINNVMRALAIVALGLAACLVCPVVMVFVFAALALEVY